MACTRACRTARARVASTMAASAVRTGRRGGARHRWAVFTLHPAQCIPGMWAVRTGIFSSVRVALVPRHAHRAAKFLLSSADILLLAASTGPGKNRHTRMLLLLLLLLAVVHLGAALGATWTTAPHHWASVRVRRAVNVCNLHWTLGTAALLPVILPQRQDLFESEAHSRVETLIPRQLPQAVKVPVEVSHRVFAGAKLSLQALARGAQQVAQALNILFILHAFPFLWCAHQVTNAIQDGHVCQ